MSTVRALNATSYYPSVAARYYNIAADDNEEDDAMLFTGIFTGADSFEHGFWGAASWNI